MDQAAAMIAHDLRNVLQVAISAVSVTRRRLIENDRALAGTLADALDALDRASLLAHRLSTPGVHAVAPELVHVAATVLGLRRLLGQALGDGIRVETLVSDGLSPILCDGHQLEDALLNLAVNARDAMSGQGVLLIEALRCDEDAHGPQCIALTVADTGCGMSKDVADRAFEPFFTTKADRGGTGVGLHNVRSFVERLGGSIELLTSQTRGTRIRLHLPAVVAPQFQGAL
jgi:signal transduction histidine kinase